MSVVPSQLTDFSAAPGHKGCFPVICVGKEQGAAEIAGMVKPGKMQEVG